MLSFLIVHRGLAPQNKPELQKVLEKRKREQILKAQKEEQEAHKKRSDLEIELMKRQQKLEQVINYKELVVLDWKDKWFGPKGQNNNVSYLAENRHACFCSWSLSNRRSKRSRRTPQSL